MHGCCPSERKKKDYLLLGSVAVIVPCYILGLLFIEQVSYPGLAHFSSSVVELLHKMWWGLLLGIFFVGVLERVPREFVISALGKKKGLTGICRATLAGVLLDLCSHGILLVGMKLYERGASLGQTMAFLIASPWNSFSLTLILWALIGLKWTLIFIVLSVVIAIISGLIFDKLVDRGTLPANPNKIDVADDFKFFAELKKLIKEAKFTLKTITDTVKDGFSGSKMILKWIFFGIILASAIRTFVPVEYFKTAFGPTALGLLLTIIAATIIEVCSEGSTPIAADIMTTAKAPGNSFAFLMTGVSTDYTEIMGLKETTSSWKISLFLPLVTLPQVVLLGYILNNFS